MIAPHVHIVSTKERVQWTNDEKRLVDRATAMLRTKGLVLKMECGLPLCPQVIPQVERDATSPSGVSIICGCRRHQLAAPPTPLSRRAARKFVRAI